MIRIFTIICVVLISSCGLTTKSIKSDIAYFHKTLIDLHPNLYQQYSKGTIDSVFVALEAQCSAKMTKNEFLFALNKTNKYYDGHTEIEPFPSPKSLPAGYFPDVKFIGDEIFIGNDRICYIAGIPAQDILRDLDNMVSWEGSGILRNNQKNYIFTKFLLQSYKINAPYDCRIESDGGFIRDKLFDLISQTEMMTNVYPAYSKDYHHAPLHSRFLKEDSIAILYYNSSDLDTPPPSGFENMEAFFMDYLSTFYNDMKTEGSKYLFIDVSQNRGGTDKAHEYVKQGLKYDSYNIQQKVYVNKEALQVLNSAGKLNDPEMLKYVSDIIVRAGEKCILEEIETIEGKAFGFEGMVFIVMGTDTYSAGYDFCEEAARNRMGVLVGQEPGQFSPYSANSFLFRMPHSKIEFCCPATFIRSEPSVVDHTGFLKPHIPYPMDHPLELEDFKRIIKMYSKRD